MVSDIKDGVVESNVPLGFEALSPIDAGRLAAVLALGMCIAVREHAVTPQYACDKLFRPSLIQRLRRLGVDSAVCESIADALEIEDIANFVKVDFELVLDRTMAILKEFLRGTQERDLTERTSWLR